VDDLLGIVDDLVTRNAKPGDELIEADADTALADRGLNSLASSR
jgi:hypothetical protein